MASFDEQMVSGSEAEQRAAISAMWQEVAAGHGGNLADPVAAATVTGVTEAVERLLLAAQVIRYGDPARGIGPNELDGIDHVSAQVILDLMRGLQDAAQDARPEQQQRM
ncbi:hypothetical protein [Kitasatospora sp. CMC57]|uniref:hypothetical protein n=1 Tax=Kitasatospora sp. CMC57 TaxID=3231513 RepID=UPI0038B5FC58